VNLLRKGSKATPAQREKYKAMWKDPSIREKRIAGITNAHKDLDVKKRHSDGIKRYYNKPGSREKRSEIMQEIGNRPEVREKRRNTMLEVWSDPENLEKQCILMKEIQNRPEVTVKRTGPNAWNWKGGPLSRHTPLEEAKDCGSYLGIIIAERVLSTFFEHMERMPRNNRGFDYICGKGYKIDVKSGCILQYGNGNPFWHFDIRKNKIADYFLLLGFDNRENLEPQHVWLIPGNIINDRVGFAITFTENGLKKWLQYEKPLDKVVECCAAMKGESIA
jgi:hypothetical protein